MLLKKNLTALLHAQGLTAAELARRANVPKQSISQWLGGSEPRKLSHLKRVAEVLGVTVDALCFSSDREPNSILSILTQDGWIAGTFEIKIRKVTK